MTAITDRTLLACRRPSALLASLLIGLAMTLAACSTATAPTTAPASAPVASVPGASPGGLAALPAEITVQQAAEMRDAGSLILDVREPDEWAAGHIPGATLIPLGELASRIADVPRDRDVVVICRSGNRSAQGRDILLGAGFAAVTSVAGGMNDWTAAGLPTETGS